MIGQIFRAACRYFADFLACAMIFYRYVFEK